VQRRRSLTLPAEQRQTSHVQVFLDGRCHPLKRQEGEDYEDRIELLLQQANKIWQAVQSFSERINDGEWKDLGQDMSLDSFVDDQLRMESTTFSSEDVDTIKLILESLFSNTAGTSNALLGVHEAAREEFNWDFTESNFRTEYCFAEFVKYYLNRIDQLNQQSLTTSSQVQIIIKTRSPIFEIGSSNHEDGESSKASGTVIRLETEGGGTITCNKCVVAVPLSILKANKLLFCDDFKIPPDMQKAIDTIQMLSGMKAHCLLKIGVDITCCSRLMKLTELFFCPGEIFSQIWLRRDETSVFLTGFCVANCRDRLLSCTLGEGEARTKREVAQNFMLDQLKRLFEDETVFVSPDSPTCSSFVLHDWSDDEYIMGTYSSPSIDAGWQTGQTNCFQEKADDVSTLRESLVKSIKDSIWLAGEHANTKTCATVQAAMESGTNAANKVVQSLLRGYLQSQEAQAQR